MEKKLENSNFTEKFENATQGSTVATEIDSNKSNVYKEILSVGKDFCFHIPAPFAFNPTPVYF